MMTADELFWDLATELQAENSDIVEGTIMKGRCLRLGKEFLAMGDFKGSGMVVKLPKHRVAELIAEGTGKPFAPAKKVFKEWVGVAELNRELWKNLLLESVDFVGTG